MDIIYLDKPSYLPERAIERLKTLGNLTVYDDMPTPQEAIRRLSNADIAIVEWTEITDEMFSQVSRLKCIVLVTTGYEFVDGEAARKRGITVCNTPHYSTQSVAEHVFAMYLALAKRLPEADKLVRSGKHEYTDHVIGMELYQRTLGIIGLGSIGRWVAQIGNGFGMKVIGHNRTSKNLPNVTELSLDEVLRESDLLALCVSVNPSTINLLSAEKFELMKYGSFIANIASNRILDEAALAKALQDGRIAGAGLDGAVTEELLKAKNVLLSPGTAWYTQASLDRNVDMFVDSVFAYINGRPQYVVN
jgi:glycerate dehydrogenase